MTLRSALLTLLAALALTSPALAAEPKTTLPDVEDEVMCVECGTVLNISTSQVAEGAKSCKSLMALAERTGVDAPIAQHVDAVVDGRMTALEMMNSFIARDTKAETD